jgi:hypothetical protein
MFADAGLAEYSSPIIEGVMESMLPLEIEETTTVVAGGLAELMGIESVAAVGGPVGMAVAGVGIGGYMLYNLIHDAIKKD